MTKRSVALVGVLIVMAMIGSSVIGALSGSAASVKPNGSVSTVYLPLIMKFFAPFAASDFYMTGNIEDGTGGLTFASPAGFSRSLDETPEYRAFFSPPQECTARDLHAELILYDGTTTGAGYELELSIEYVGGAVESMTCLIADPDTTCDSTTQLTIPADSELYIRVRTLNINHGRTQIPFSWICSA